VSIALVLQVFRGLHSAGLQNGNFFYNRTNNKQTKSVLMFYTC